MLTCRWLSMRWWRSLAIVAAGVRSPASSGTRSSGRGFVLGQSVFVQAGDEVIEAAEAKARLDRGALFLDARPRRFLQDEPHPGRSLAARGRLRHAPSPRLEPRLRDPLQPRGLLQRLRLRGQPHRGPQATREGDPRRDPERGLAGLDRRRLSHEDGSRSPEPPAPTAGSTSSSAWPSAAFFVYASLDKIAAPRGLRQDRLPVAGRGPRPARTSWR